VKPRPKVQQLAEGILRSDRVLLSQAITIIESNLEEDRKLSADVLDQIIHATGNAIRIGITGVPGVGKSSFIETFGKTLTKLGIKVAVLTIDPSSQATGGSILGDKTRMEELSRDPLAYVRPSPSGKMLGGVAEKTYDAILLCEAAGFDVIVVETVGVGQSEVSVKNLVDFFLLLMLAGAGDELQGIKKGITEVAHAIVITKVDGDNVKHAREAVASYEQALHLGAHSESWMPRVMTTSAVTGAGISEVWNMVLEHRQQTRQSGEFERIRTEQRVSAFTEYFKFLLLNDANSSQALKKFRKNLEERVIERKIAPRHAAEALLKEYKYLVKTFLDREKP
jgi:LAO/AO transport system kinase